MSTFAKPVISFAIGGVSKDMLIDSGSASNGISAHRGTSTSGLKIELQSCKSCLLMGGRELEVEVPVSVGKNR